MKLMHLKDVSKSTNSLWLTCSMMDVTLRRLLSALLLLMYVEIAKGETEVLDQSGTVRMYNESGVTLNGAQYEGYIEVLRDGTWGSVCGFDSLEAAVVCRQLFPVGGYAQYNSRYSREGADAATKPVWMYDIKCQGDEASLLDCQYQDAQAAGKTACSEEEYYAYIKCSPDKAPDGVIGIDGPIDPETGELNGNMIYRHDGIWTGLCNSDVGGLEAAMVCRSLGRNASAIAAGSLLWNSLWTSTVWIESLSCNATSASMEDCSYELADTPKDCFDLLYSKVICTPDEGGTPSIPARLAGTSCTEGRVEVYANGFWGQVCSLNKRAAKVLCRQLGIGDEDSSPEVEEIEGSADRAVWVSSIKCSGDEESIEDCEVEAVAQNECPDNKYAFVTCERPRDKDWDVNSICTKPGPCQQEPGQCSDRGYCVYQPAEAGAPCSLGEGEEGLCNGAGTCLPLLPPPLASPEPHPPELPSPAPLSPGPLPSPEPLPPSPGEGESPVPPSPQPPVPPPATCPVHSVPVPVLPEGYDQFNWATGANAAGGIADCWDVQTQSFLSGPQVYGSCTAPNWDPGQGIKDLGQSYCDESTREAQWDFSSAIAQGGSAAQTAVAALVHAFMELVCIDGDQFITITEPPDELVPEGVTYLDFYMQYYTNLVNAAELAGLSLCTMFWAFPQGNEAAQQYLVTIHTGPEVVY